MKNCFKVNIMFIMMKDLFNIIESERVRQRDQIELIASENVVSENVLKAIGSVLTNKYAEGYPGKRYYGGCEFVDKVENIAINEVKKLFNCSYANVQPHSGASANLAALFACLKPGDVLLGMSLSCGGHLTHGARPTISGKWFDSISYGVSKETNLINYDEVLSLACEFKPKVIIAGASAYPRQINFKKFREIADNIGAILIADIAHYAGLIVAGEYESPFPYADIVTSTTHKTLRGPRGGIILTNDENFAKKIDKAVFPGVQGGPLMHIIAGKAAAFIEAGSEDFKKYAKQMVLNAKALAEELILNGVKVLTNGTDSHMVIIDLRGTGVTGVLIEKALEDVGMTCNKNAIPFDPLPVSETSGIRIGTPVGTSRGMKEEDFRLIATFIAEVIKKISSNNYREEDKNNIKKQITLLCKKLSDIPHI